jgi:oxygen-dependent protoporphyrinogen oxidase
VKTIVVGAGLAGSTAAYRLRRLGHEVLLLERKARVGGRAWTHRQDGYSIDVGADVILSFYERTFGLLRELGRLDNLVGLDNSSTMHDGRNVHAMRPASPLGIFTHPALRLRDMVRLAYTAARAQLSPRIDLFDLDALAASDNGETIASWARRSMGERAYQHVFRPGIETRWYYSCEEAAAPLAKALARLAPRTRFYCLDPGMGSFAEWLTAEVECALETEVTAIEASDGGVKVLIANGESHEADAVVVAADAGRAADLLPQGSARSTLEAVRFANNIRTVFGYERNPWPRPKAKAGFATGPGEHLVAGVTMVSGKSAPRVPPGAEAAEIHFSGWASGQLDDGEAIEASKEAIAKYFGAPGAEPDFALLFRCDPGLPIPVPGQYRRLAAARRAMPPRVRLAGDYLSHATIEGAIVTGEAAAAEIHALGG